MDRTEKIDCRANGEVIYRATRLLHIKGSGNLFTGSSAKLNGSRSLISTKNGIDSPVVWEWLSVRGKISKKMKKTLYEEE